MGFFFFFNYSKYLNQTYFLINKPLNSYIKQALLAKGKQGKSNTQPQPTTQNTQKNTEPEPNKLVTHHPMFGEEGPQSVYTLEVNLPSKIGGILTASDIDGVILLYHWISETASRTVGFGVVVETATAETATIAGRFLGGNGYRTLPPTKLGIRAYFRVPENYKNIDPRGLVRELYLSNQKYRKQLNICSSNRKVTGTDTDGKEVIRHWVDINPAAKMVRKNTSWHIETTSSTIRIYPVTKDVFVSQ